MIRERTAEKGECATLDIGVVGYLCSKHRSTRTKRQKAKETQQTRESGERRFMALQTVYKQGRASALERYKIGAHHRIGHTSQ